MQTKQQRIYSINEQIEKLQREKEKLSQTNQIKELPFKHVNWQELYIRVVKIINKEIEEDECDDRHNDNMYYVYETVLTFIYGEDFWKKRNNERN